MGYSTWDWVSSLLLACTTDTRIVGLLDDERWLHRQNNSLIKQARQKQFLIKMTKKFLVFNCYFSHLNFFLLFSYTKQQDYSCRIITVNKLVCFSCNRRNGPSLSHNTCAPSPHGLYCLAQITYFFHENQSCKFNYPGIIYSLIMHLQYCAIPQCLRGQILDRNGFHFQFCYLLAL